MSDFLVRCAVISEQKELEALQLRASLTNAGDRSAALCVIGNPHAYDFYTACGFDVIGTMETRFGSGLLMRKLV